ncbi:MAG: hypothetical protein LBJ17_05070, partial [Dysgonamonadaceae bacterium]|jgi:hypothetical protein|nr:hypothetical protein [Dysgonamonadaceae bacterium]
LSIAVIATLIGCDLFRDLLKLNKDEIPTELPAETQTGANTFGCYINDSILFVTHWEFAPFTHGTIHAGFNRKETVLYVEAYSELGRINLNISNNIHIGKGESAPIFSGLFQPAENGPCFHFIEKNIGEVTLSKFDTINRIVSGTFQFIGQCYDPLFEVPGDSTVNVSNGRFDIKLEIY